MSTLTAVPMIERAGLRLHYTERGPAEAPPVVLLHGLLWSSRMFERLVTHLPEHRAVLLDLHGHGKSSRPADPSRYTWQALADDVLTVLDHLGMERAVVGGLSLGANVTLATAYTAPHRVRAMILEMPVLERGHAIGRTLFSALAGVYAGGAPVLAPVARRLSRVPAPRRVPELVALRDVVSAPPRPAAALLRGLLDDDPLPEDDESLAALTMPALVIGHRHDRLHALDDARDLAERLPNGRFAQASSILEHRLHADRLAGQVREFLDGLPD